MNHKNFDFKQISDKTNDYFWLFLPDGDFFQKNPAVTHNYILAPNTMLMS